MQRIRRQRKDQRRGAAMLAFVAGLLVIGTFALWLTATGALGATGYLGHYWSSGALYASESGVEMAMRELSLGADRDGDGTAGTVSNDGDDTNDPSAGTGTFHASASGNTYTAEGEWQAHRRVTEVVTQ